MLKIEYVDVAKLKPYDKNTRKHEDYDVSQIAKSIEQYGFNDPIGIWGKDNIIVEGHGKCHIIAESSVKITGRETKGIVYRIAGKMKVDLKLVPQDEHLSKNQRGAVRCGDNGIFKGMPVTDEQVELATIARDIYKEYNKDGKYVLDGQKLIVCQSYAMENNKALRDITAHYNTTINPLGYWTGGIDVDAGATNRKLGSDMGDSVTGGGLHGKDLSKADVSVNIYAFLRAQATGEPVELSCAIGDDTIDGKPYAEVVEIARTFIKERGGFEKFAEWGLI